ncbi:coiled-coil domain-containing protein 40-like isoform X2 [Haliotis rufescens]|uniref:coiled-coil domain-containing protein 40-like isoform X2 n=1 Tax=Haliotis rufescens TaxID=6454 RepID=UPI00201F32C8|nr:coiled-coil domain-containing protein 40-like isoform X2 [Haliotis rufescens]
MADKQERPSSSKVQDVVSKVTTEALKEFETDAMEEGGETKPSSRPGSAKPSSRPQSGRKSAGGSRPTSAAPKADSRPTSATSKADSRPTSATSKADSRPTSATPKAASRPTSATPKADSRPTSAAKTGRTPTPTSDRPPSATARPSSATARPSSAAGRPASAAKSVSPTSPLAVTGERVGSTTPTAEGKVSPQDGSRPASAAKSGQGSRPASAAKSGQGSRPASAAKSGQGSRPASNAGSRPGSGIKRTDSVTEKEIDVADEKEPDNTMALELAAEDEDDPQKYDFGVYDDGEPGDYPEPKMPSEPPQTHFNITDILDRPPSDPEGDDSDGGSDDEEEAVDEVGADTDDASDNETDMVVLDPDHPLMRRFQNALKNHLEKQNEKVSLELRELEENLRSKKRNREDLGVELYGVQQELARYQMMLEQNHDEYSTLNQDRQHEEQQLDEVRSLYKDNQLAVNKEKKRGAELQAEVENLALRLFYMDNAKEDVRGDIAIMRRAAEKAESEVAKVEMEKQKQDLYVDRLVERVDKLKEEMAMFEAQIIAQSDETKAAKEALMEAHMEIEAITLEKKQLFQQWNSSLIGMRRRDEAHSAMQEALNQQQQKILSLETEIEGFKKSIQKEQEQNEKLCQILAKTNRDIDMVKKQLTTCQAKHDALKAEYTTFTRMLHETEQTLNKATTDKTLRMNELNGLRKQIEREYQEKVKLEDEIMEKIRDQLTMDKASQYTKKLTKKMRDLTKSLETQMAEVENTIARNALDTSNVKARTERLKKILQGLDDEIRQKNDIISKSENEIIKRNAIIERKQNLIDQFNKKLEHMINSAGGVELGPLEVTITSLQKTIDGTQQEITELQQMWLRQQSELVRLTKDKEDQSQDVEKHKKQLTILLQKKIRTEHDIDQQRRETYDIDRHIRNMQNDMIKLNTLLHREKGYEVELEQGTSLLENDFIANLKEAERSSIEMQDNLDSVKEEKERLLNSLVEAERQIMLWEKKTQLARETRAAVDSEIGQGEIRAMKSEIHRMQVRYSQLMKQQEKMIQDMEKAVSRRDTIVTRGDSQSKMKQKVVTKGTFERQMAEHRRKIKQTTNDASSCDSDIHELRDHQQELSGQLEEKQVNCQQLQGSADTLDGDIERLLDVKLKNMKDLVAKQQKHKYYQQVKDGKYTMLCKSESSLETEHNKQIDRMQALSTIVDRLNQEFPHVQPALRNVTIALSSRGVPHDED